MDIPNYLIDIKLKVNRHYPPELEVLTNLFERGFAFLPFITEPKSRKVRGKVGMEIQLIEKTFLDFFLNQSNLIKYELDLEKWKKKHIRVKDAKTELNKELQRLREAAKEEPGPCDKRIVIRSIDRINRKLKFFNPRIQGGGKGYQLNFTPYITPENTRAFIKKPGLLAVMGWAWLAKVIDKLDPRLFHQCDYDDCKKIFFSRQIKKYHTECRSKYFSEKYKKEGRNAERQRQYRQRKNKKMKVRKSA